VLKLLLIKSTLINTNFKDDRGLMPLCRDLLNAKLLKVVALFVKKSEKVMREVVGERKGSVTLENEICVSLLGCVFSGSSRGRRSIHFGSGKKYENPSQEKYTLSLNIILLLRWNIVFCGFVVCLTCSQLRFLYLTLFLSSST